MTGIGEIIQIVVYLLLPSAGAEIEGVKRLLNYLAFYRLIVEMVVGSKYGAFLLILMNS